MACLEPERPARKPDTNFITFEVGEDTDAYPMFAYWKPTKMDNRRYSRISPDMIHGYLEQMFQRLLLLAGAFADD